MRSRGSLAAVTAALIGVAVSLGLGLAVDADALQAEGKSIQDGVFTAEQTEAGAAVWERVCSECHMSIEFGPEYLVGWNGATVGDFFDQIVTTMPYENPGALDAREYADVLTYLFKINGVAPGDSEMGDTSEELQGIVIDGPYTWAGDAHER